jgi:plasmid maintenance system antidote protein VapI
VSYRVRYQPAEAFGVAEYLDDELRKRGQTWDQLAAALGMTREELQPTVDGARPLTMAVCRKIEAFFGVSALLWANLAMAYRKQAGQAP